MITAEKLGAWTLLGTASFLLALSDLGLTTAVQRAVVRGDHALARRTISLSLLVIGVCGPTAAVITYAYLLNVPSLPAALRPEVAEAAVITLIGGVIGAATYPYRGLVFASGGVRAVAKARTAFTLTQLLVTAGGFYVSHSLITPAAGLCAGAVAEFLLTFFAARACDPEVPRMPALPADRSEIAASFRDGAASLVISVAVFTAIRVDVVVLAHVAPLAIVASYGVASRAVDMLYLLAKQATVALMPQLGRAEEREDAIRLGTLIYCGTVGCGMSALAVNGQPLLAAWVGEVGGTRVTAVALALLAMAAIIASGRELAGSMLALGGRTAWGPALPIVAGSLANVAISVAGAARYGTWAVAGSTVVGNLLTTTWMLVRAGYLAPMDSARHGARFLGTSRRQSALGRRLLGALWLRARGHRARALCVPAFGAAWASARVFC